MIKGLLRDLRTRRFRRLFFTHSFAAFGLLSAVAGAIDVFVPGELAKTPALVWVLGVLSFLYGLFRAWPRPIEESYSTPATKISLVAGDLFDLTGHLVIGTCDTFDTASPQIAKNSVQGQFLDRVYGGDGVQLDAHLRAALADEQVVAQVNKLGKTDRYALGTVATLKQQARRFFMLAYTSMDERNVAHGTSDGFWSSLSRLWIEVRAESNGGRVCIPVIGGGQSKLSQVLPAEDSVRFIAMSFMLASRAQKICDELVIVALPKQYEKMDHLELQAFLSSLKES